MLSARLHSIALGLVAISTAVFLIGGLLSSRSNGAESPAAPSPHSGAYLPSISDLMIATIQPRHERLWRAEQDRNWEFAAYELGNLRGAFDRLGRAYPTEQGISFPDIIGSVTDVPFKELNSAVQAKDDAAFGKAYTDLTDACNSCHQALNRSVVVIGTPDGTSSSDLKTTNASRR
jgi:hypothetical protein